MKNRMTSGCVTVISSPFSICSDSTVRNEPRLPRTLPNRTEAKRVVPPARDCTISSASRLVAPRIETGSAALSVEMRMNLSTPTSSAAPTSVLVPRTLDFTPSAGCLSSSGRCLCAAAWNTTSGRTALKIWWIRPASRMSAMIKSSVSSSALPSNCICTRCRFDSSWSSR